LRVFEADFYTQELDFVVKYDNIIQDMNKEYSSFSDIRFKDHFVGTVPEYLPENSWIGVNDLQLVQHLSEDLNIPFPEKKVEEIGKELTLAVEEAFGREHTVILSAQMLQERAARVLDRITDREKRPQIITLDPSMVSGDISLEMTRLIDPRKGNIIGEGNRPGTPYVEEQYDNAVKVAESTGNWNALLVDDVIFSGGTVEEIVEKLGDRGINVEGIIGGVVTEKGLQRLKKSNIPVTALFIAPNSTIDIVDFRDLVPSVPLGGRAVGHVNGRNRPEPLYDKNGIAFRAPYLGQPINRAEQWASIPKEYAADISIMGWAAALALHEELNYNRGKAITFGDLQKIKLSTGYPGTPPKRMENGALNPDIAVVEVLNHKLNKAKGISSSRTIFSSNS
jgi:hypothetical protein